MEGKYKQMKSAGIVQRFKTIAIGDSSINYISSG